MPAKIRLGDVATYINGYPFKPEQRGKQGLPIIRIQDLTGNSYDLGFFNGEYPLKVEVNNGDVLISWSASLGVYVWNGGKALLNQHIFKVVFDKEKIHKAYFIYAVRYNLDVMVNKMHGATMKHIVKKDFDNIQIPFPNINKQQEISSTIEKVEKAIKLRQKQLNCLDNLVKSRFIEMFGDQNLSSKYKLVSFKTLVEKSLRGPFGSAMKKDLYVSKGNDTYKVYIQINAIQKDQNLGDYYISKEYFDQKMHTFEVYPNEYIITCDGTLGKLLKLDSKMEPGVISSSLLKLKLNYGLITDEYFTNLWELYLLPNLIKEARNACLVHLPSMKVIGEKLISLPPLEEQISFSKLVNEVDKSKFVIQKSLNELQLLYDSLMQKYFG